MAWFDKFSKNIMNFINNWNCHIICKVFYNFVNTVKIYWQVGMLTWLFFPLGSKDMEDSTVTMTKKDVS